jgi:hypothetical protein
MLDNDDTTTTFEGSGPDPEAGAEPETTPAAAKKTAKKAAKKSTASQTNES